MRRLAVLALAAGVLVAAAPADAVATALRADPVYVDPAAEAMLPAGDEADLRQRVQAAGTPVFVAVLPHAAGDADAALRDVHEGVGVPGTYVVVVGDALRTASDVVRATDELATAAVREHAASGVGATLDALVDDVAAAAAEGEVLPRTTAPPDRVDAGAAEDQDDDAAVEVPGVVLAVLAVAGAGGVAGLVARGRRQARPGLTS